MPLRSGRGPLRPVPDQSSREGALRTYVRRWAVAAGAQLLVVDPAEDKDDLTQAMAVRGVNVTWVGSTVDGLIEFGRVDPHAVVVAPEAPGAVPATEFVEAIGRHGSPYVIAAVDHGRAGDVSELMLAGAQAVVPKPYTPGHLWELLHRSAKDLEDHARVTVGRIELDAGAYRVTIDGCRIADLPLKEFELLRALMLRAPDVVTDDELREELWGADAARSGNTIAMHATRLRARLGDAAVVRRIRGRGYSLTVG